MSGVVGAVVVASVLGVGAAVVAAARRARRSDFNARIGYSGMPLSLWPSGPMRTRWFSHVKRGPDHDVV